MAYMDEMALEREKSRQAMLAGKQPLLGADTSAALQELGVSLGLVPKGATPTRTAQLMSDLIKSTKGSIRVDDPTPLKVAPLTGKLASLPPQKYTDESAGVAESITGAFKGAKDTALQKKLQEEQRKSQQGTPSPPYVEMPGKGTAYTGSPHSDSPDASGVMREPGQLAGNTYQDDLRFLNDRGGHASILKDGKIVHVPVDTPGAYGQVSPELAARLRSAAEAFEKENPGKQAKFGEFSRGTDVQEVYWKESEGGTKYAVAEPGKSRHQKGAAGDLPDSPFRKWLYDGNKEKHGLHFPVPGDAPHVEVDSRHPKTYATPSAPSAPGVSAPGAPSASTGPGNRALVEQRRPVAAFFDGDPAAKDRMAAVAYAEDNNSREGRISVHEAGANRVVAAGRPVSDIIDPKYYQPMHDPKQIPKYEAALKRIQTDPAFRAQLHAEIDEAHKNGSNFSNLATDFGSGNVAAKAKGNSTHTGRVGDNDFFRKDRNPEAHGGGTVNAVKQWHAKTDADVKAPPAAAAAKPLAPGTQGPKPTATVAPEYKPTTAPQASPQAAPAPEASAAPAETPPAAPPGPQIPVTAPPPPTPAAAAPAPAVPVAAATAPAAPPTAQPPSSAAKPAPTVNPAHALLDRKVIDLVKQGDPSQAGKIPGFIADKTLREALNMPMIGSAVAAEAKKNLGKAGITPQQFDDAVKEGAPKPSATAGKRSEAPVVPEQMQKVRYAAADTGTMTDAGPELPDDTKPTLDPASQPAVQNADGTISTVRTIGVEDGGKEVNIPTVPAEGGRIMPDDEARARYKETGQHLGKFDTVEQAGAAAEQLHQTEAGQISQHPQGQQGAMTPGLMQALTNIFKDESRIAPEMPIPAEALPVLPAQPAAPPPGTGSGGLSLAPGGLSSVPTGALAPGAMPTQGGSIAMAGMLPAIENSTYSSPLIDSAAANTGSAFGAGNLSPIPWETLGGWGWGGGGGGFDWGGGGGGFDFGGGGMSFGGFE